MDRLSKEKVFMDVASIVAKRSPDAQTQVGCVITLDDRILSTGYNGFPRNIDYSSLPNVRPGKYDWMMHAERNAIAWCEKRPINGTAYVTAMCCNTCLMTLWQHGITTVYELDVETKFSNAQTKLIRDKFLELSGMKTIRVLLDQKISV